MQARHQHHGDWWARDKANKIAEILPRVAALKPKKRILAQEIKIHFADSLKNSFDQPKIPATNPIEHPTTQDMKFYLKFVIIVLVLLSCCSSMVQSLSSSVVETPRTDLPYNCGLASTRDAVLWTCQRPGQGTQGEDGKLDAECAIQQMRWMKEEKNIQHALVLLDANEMDQYPDPGLVELYKGCGITAHCQPMGEAGAAQKILDLIKKVESDGESIAAHCTGGKGRAGRVAAWWIATRYGLSADEATSEVLEVAKKDGINRRGSNEMLEDWLAKSSISL